MSDPIPGDCSWCKWAKKLPGELGYDYVACGNEKSPVYYQVLFEHYNRCGVFEPEGLTDEDMWDSLSDEALQQTERSLQGDDIAKVLGSSEVIPLKSSPSWPLGWMALAHKIRDRLTGRRHKDV